MTESGETVKEAQSNGESPETKDADAPPLTSEQPAAAEEADATEKAQLVTNGESNGDSATPSQEEEEEAREKIPTDRILLHNLSKGFESLTSRRNSKLGQPVSERSVCSCATVNFIDPTSSLVAVPPTSKFNILSPLSKQSTTPTKEAETPSVDLYPKLTSILERDYNSTLHSVPYQNPRSGKKENIDNLYIRSIVTKAHGVGDTYVPWGGTAATQASPVSDPAEWHNGPHCHVYIAACEGLEHYRQKVRPALQAFVSQIEGAAGNSTSSKDSGNSRNTNSSSSSATSAPAGGNYSAHYVIIYVPIGKRNAERSSSTPNVAPLESGAAALATKRMGSLASRMRRQIQQSSTPSNSDHGRSASESALDVTETASAELTASDAASAPPPGPIAHSSRVEKELYRKFTTDFPNGKTCIMTTLMESQSENSAASTSPLKNQEWNNFLRMLGSAIVSGFNDRCRRYDEELRRLDALRAAARSPVRKNSSRKLTKPPKNPFDLSHFFLVKESLAFTYEQMQLPAEALLQYDELGAFVLEAVDLSDNGVANMGVDEDDSEENDYDGLARKRSLRKLTSVSNFGTAEDLAIAGDTNGFRRRLRSVQDLTPEVPLVLQYLYAREASLLFQLAAPVELIERSHVFINTMYSMRIKRIHALAKRKKERLSPEEQKRKRNEVEKWALRTCWDVKCASDSFFHPPFAMMKQISETSVLDGARIENGSAAQYSDDGNATEKRRPSQTGVQQMSINPIHLEAACKLSELLEFARIRLLYLGDVELGNDNPIRSMNKGLPEDMRKPWSPWTSESATERRNSPAGTSQKTSNRSIKLEDGEPLWMDGMFDSAKHFESKYVELVGSVVKLCRLAGRRRLAARLQAERAEIHILRGEYELAEKALLPAVNICAEDRWERGHFWRLFRLACCQRVCADPAAYLNTLTRCFGSEMSSVAPTKALELLQKDLEAVVGDEEISKYHLGISPFLETDLSVEATSAGNLVTPSGSMRKKVVKHFCSVGETMGIALSITSHLPQAIYVDSIRLVLVTYDSYETIYANRGDVEEELVGAFQIIPFEPPTVLEPGENEFKINWVPMSTGQYILSTVEIRWKASCFFYRSCAMRKPLIGIDVVPSDPTQTVELHPLFLIPGHIQPVRITFNSGSDIVTEGAVELVCSEGLEIVPPGSDPKDDDWGSSCKILIPPCDAGEKVVLATSVKSTLKDAFVSAKDDDEETEKKNCRSPANGNIQTMRATVFTSYYHSLYKEVKDDITATPMKTVLEAKVTTLDRPALTVDSANVFPYTSDQAIVKVSLHCNTPVPFFIKEWKVQFPEPLRVEDRGDLNADLYGHPIAEGEALSFGFLCVFSESPFELELSEAEDNKEDEPTLRVVLQDEFGKTFNQVLSLDLDSFYAKMRKEEEYNGTKGVPVELQCSASEGLTGTPITFTYHVDTSLITKSSRLFSLSRSPDGVSLLYEISCDEKDWIIGGKVQGILKCSEKTSFDLEFVGIPTRPGVLKTFPWISVDYQSEQGDTPPIMVHSELPESFTSLSILHNVSLAYPAALEAV